MARAICLGLMLFDLALGLGCVVAPGLTRDLLWPTAGPDALVLLRRTGAIWLFFAAAEAAAWRKPTPDRLRLVALLRFMDVPADALWVLGAASDLSTLGWLGIAGAPPCNLIFGVLLWRAARRGERQAAG